MDDTITLTFTREEFAMLTRIVAPGARNIWVLLDNAPAAPGERALYRSVMNKLNAPRVG